MTTSIPCHPEQSPGGGRGALELPFIVVGSRLFVKVPGREFAPLAAFEAGADVVAVQAALAMWFIPILVTGVITFSVGIFAFAKGIADSRMLKVLPQLQQLGGFKEFIALGDGQNSELLSVTL